jgi:phosphate-selective porin OprO/OprP
MKKTSVFSASSVALAVAALCASMPAFAQVEAKVTGRVHFDIRDVNNTSGISDDRDSASYADNFEIRRARIGIVGTINKDIAYEVVGNAVGSSTNFIDTAWANYGFNKAAQFRAGRFKQPFSLEELTSSNSIDFMERSYGNQLVPGKRLGVMVHGEPVKGLNYGLSAYQNNFSEVSNSTYAGSNYAARFALNAADFAKMEDTVIHLGLAQTAGKSQVAPTSSGSTSSAPSATTRAVVVAFRDENRGLSNIYRARIAGVSLTTAAYGGVSNQVANIDQVQNGLELAIASGPFKFQAEQINSDYSATTTANTLDVKVKTDYMEFMYNITGEPWSKAYKGGAFSGIAPSSVFMKDYGGVVGNGMGAWQAGLRLSSYEATPSNSTGSNNTLENSTKATTITYALNWIMNNNARMMLNYAETKFGSAVTPLDVVSATSITKERIVSIRSQVNF